MMTTMTTSVVPS